MPLKVFQRTIAQRPVVGRRQHHLRGFSGAQGLLPSGSTQTPTITGFQSGESVFGHRRAEIVADGSGEREKFHGRNNANGVGAAILGRRIAASIAKESGDRVNRARCEWAAEDVARRRSSAPRSTVFVGHVAHRNTTLAIRGETLTRIGRVIMTYRVAFALVSRKSSNYRVRGIVGRGGTSAPG